MIGTLPGKIILANYYTAFSTGQYCPGDTLK